MTEPLDQLSRMDADLGRRCRYRANHDGPAAALTELRTGLGSEADCWGPGGHTLLPRSTPDPAEAVLLATVEFDPGAVAVWHDARQRGDADGPWALGAAWIRLGLAERLLRIATEYIGGRRTGGEPLISVSAIRTMIGEAAGDLAEADLLLATDGAEALPRAMTATATAQRKSLTLLGASGFLDAEPGRLGRVIDLLGDIFHTPEVTP